MASTKASYVEHLQEFLLRDNQPLEFLLVFNRALGDSLESRVISIGDWPISRKFVNGRASSVDEPETRLSVAIS